VRNSIYRIGYIVLRLYLNRARLIKTIVSKLSVTKSNDNSVPLYYKLVLSEDSRIKLLYIIRALFNKVLDLLLKKTLSGLILGAYRLSRTRPLLRANCSIYIIS
jgi:hypothetical protein